MKRVVAFLSVLFLAAAAHAADFGRLPHNLHVCKADDMEGLFKLREVLEKPKSGPVTNDFQHAPHQYLLLRKTQVFEVVSGSRNYLDEKSLDAEMQRRFKEEKRQYVLSESGALYFYKGGKFTDSFDCEVVTKTEAPYLQGDMLLIAYGAANTMSVRIYQLHHFGPSPPPPPPPPPRKLRPGR